MDDGPSVTAGNSESFAIRSRVERLERARTISRSDVKVEATQFFRATAQMGVQAKRRIAKPWYLVDPMSDAVKRWDALTAVVLVFTAFTTPFEVAFLRPTPGTDALFVVNRLVDAVFILDMLMQFFLLFEAPKTQRVASLYETRMRKIAARYLKGWFTVDLLSILPSLFDILGREDDEPDRSSRAMLTLRVIRALRLFKLMRLARSSRLVHRLQIRVTTPRATITLVQLICEVILISHMFACLFGFMGTFPPSPLDTWLATHGMCRPAAEPGAEPVCVSSGYLYVRCVYWGGGILTGAPVALRPDKGPFPRYISPTSDGTNLSTEETLVVMLVKFAAALFWARLVSRFVFVFNNLDPDIRDFQQGWDALNRFCAFFRIEQRAAMSLRQYYLERSEEVRAKSRMRVMRWFSPLLAEETVWDLNKEWLVGVPCFSLVLDRSAAAPELAAEAWRFLVAVALAMEVAVFVPKDRPPAGRLYLIASGTAVYQSKTLGPAESWGAEDVMLQARNVRRHRAFATTYLHVRWIGPETINALAREFPRSTFLVKFWALMRAAAEYMLAEHRAAQLESMQLTADDLMRRLNGEHPKQLGATRLMHSRTKTGGSRYALCHHALTASVLEALQGRLVITRARGADGRARFHVSDPAMAFRPQRHEEAPPAPEAGRTADADEEEGEEEEQQATADGLEV